jgi:hypothetical protein
MDTVDKVALTRTVVFVGDYFTLMTTVQLDEVLRQEAEKDDDFAIRIAAVWMGEHYGWDVLEAANDVGIVDE